MKLLVGWLINTVALLLVSKIIPGIAISDFWVAALAAGCGGSHGGGNADAALDGAPGLPDRKKRRQ